MSEPSAELSSLKEEQHPVDSRPIFRGLMIVPLGIAILEILIHVNIGASLGATILFCILVATLIGGQGVGLASAAIGTAYYMVSHLNRGKIMLVGNSMAGQLATAALFILGSVLVSWLQRRQTRQALAYHAAKAETEFQRQIAAELAEREAALNEMASAMPLIVWAADARGNIYYINRRWFEYTGQPEANDGVDWIAFLHPDDQERSIEAWGRVVSEGRGGANLSRIRNHGGEYRWHLTYSAPVRDATGRVLRWYGACSDVHEQKMAEEGLRRARTWLELTQTAAHAGGWEFDLLAGHIVWSEAVYGLFAVDPDEFVVTLESWLDQIDERDRDRMRQALQQGMDTAEEFDCEVRVAATGNWIAVRAQVIVDASGRSSRMVGMLIDISGLKEAQAAAAAAEQRLQRVLENTTAGFGVFDAKWRYVYHNSLVYEELGRPQGGILGKVIWELMPRLRDTEFHRRAMEAQRTGRSAKFDFQAEHTGQWYQVHITPSGDEFLVISMNITEAKRSAEAEKQLLLLLDNVEEFIAAFDEAWRIVYVNARLLAYLGASRDEVVGRALYDVMPWLAETELAAHVAEAHATQRSSQIELHDPATGIELSIHLSPAQNSTLLFAHDVSQQKAVEAALRRSENQYAAIVKQAAVGIAQLDLEGRYLIVNRRYGEILERDPDELVGHSPDEFTHPEDVLRTQREIQRLLRGEETVLFQKRYLLRNGRTVWINKSLAIVRDSSGEPLFIAAVVQDISAMHEAQSQVERLNRDLRDRVDELQAILHEAPVGLMFARDPDCRTILVNPAGARILGYRSEDSLEITSENGLLPQFPFKYLRDGAALPHHALPIYYAATRGVPVPEQEFEIERADGSAVHVVEYAQPLFDDGGKVRGCISIFMDLTERLRAVRALQESEERFRSMADAAPVLIWVADTRGACTWLNRSWLEFTGRSSAEQIGDGWLDGLHPEDRERCGSFFKSKFIRREPFEAQYRLRRHDGEWRWVTDRGIPRFDPAGHFEGFIGSCVDITDIRSALAELRRLNEELEQRVSERSRTAERRAQQLRLLANELTLAEQRERRRMAQLLHDHLQQLLVAAKLQLGILRSRTKEPRALEQITAAQDSIDQTIQASRSLTQELSPPVLYDAGLKAALEWLAGWMNEKHGIQIEMQLSAEAEPQAEDLRAFLFQAARELLFNVVKHSGVMNAGLTLEALDEEIQLTVSDTGRGMVVRLDHELPRSESGFGLFSIRERFEVLGGRMEIESAPGEGTRIMLFAPRREAEPLDSTSRVYASAQRIALAAAQGISLQPGASPNDGDGTLRVLLVDDHEILRAGLASLLADDPRIQVVGEAGNGEDAVRLARELRPDIILMDLAMPGMNGIEATRHITTEQPDARIIGLSMHDQNDMAESMQRAGAVAYLPKGCPADQLIAAIRQFAARPASRNESLAN